MFNREIERLRTQVDDLERRNKELVHLRRNEDEAVDAKVEMKINAFVRDLQPAVMRDETNRRYIIDELAVGMSRAMTEVFRRMGRL